MTDHLSPAALIILDRFRAIVAAKGTERLALSAALRAAAEIVAPVSYEDIYTDGRVLQYEKEDSIREKLLAIATELENA
jgi:hypothetical protein